MRMKTRRRRRTETGRKAGTVMRRTRRKGRITGRRRRKETGTRTG